MNVEQLRAYGLAKKATSESLPFDDTSLVLKVMDKMFAILSLDEGAFMNLKCDPERSLELRAQYPEKITPGYHMNKEHWNSVYFKTEVPEELVLELIDHSYDLTVAGMTKKKQAELKEM